MFFGTLALVFIFLFFYQGGLIAENFKGNYKESLNSKVIESELMREKKVEDISPSSENFPEASADYAEYAKNEIVNPNCLDNYTSLPRSTKFKDAPWSTFFIESTGGKTIRGGVNDRFIDLNGDGLLDYIYTIRSYKPICFNSSSRWVDCSKENSQFYYNTIKDCVYLNNGNGWDLVYRCVSDVSPKNDVPNGEISGYVFYYYGDCADISSES